MNINDKYLLHFFDKKTAPMLEKTAHTYLNSTKPTLRFTFVILRANTSQEGNFRNEKNKVGKSGILRNA